MAAHTLMELLVKLGVDTGSYNKGLDEAEKKATGAGGKIVGGLSAVGGAAVMGAFAAAGAGAVALTGFLASTIAPASDLGETMSKVGVVFGESADKVFAFGEKAAQSLGISQEQALAAAGTYGNLFRAMEIGEDASTDMSLGLVQLAADLASFNNLDPTVALDKLRAGLTGETEPLKTLGVNISAVATEAKALELGFKKVDGVLSPAAKAQANYALIMEQTALAQGDFNRTADGLANRQRIIKAQFTDMKSTIGTALLPLIEKLAGMLSDAFSNPVFKQGLDKFIAGLSEFATTAIESIPLIIEKFKNIVEWLKNNEGVIIGVLAALGVAIGVFVYTTVIPAVIAMITAFAPVILVMLAVAAVAYLVYEAWTNNWGGIQEKVQPIIDWLVNAFQIVVAWLQEKIPVALAWLKNTWETVLLPALTAMVDWFKVAIPAAIQWLTDAWNNVLLPAITNVWNWITTNLFPLFEALAEFIGAAFTLAVTAFAGLWQNVLLPAIQDVGNWIKTNLQPIWEDLVKFFEDKAWPIIQDIGNFLGGKFKDALGWVSTAIADVVEWIKKMTDALKNIELPDWLTPGSPTPWEIGLLGIADALDQVAKSSLPKFNMQLGLTADNSALVGVNGNTIRTQGVDGQGSGNVTIEAINVYPSSGADAIQYSIQRAKAMAL